MTGHQAQTVGELGEFGLIAAIGEWLAPQKPPVLAGIGDDACALLTGEGRCLLLTTDAMVEGVHFRRGWGTWRQLGRKAMAASLSDIAAMGGKPLCSLVTLGVESTTPVSAVEEVYGGLHEVAGWAGIELAGGDTVRFPSGVFLDVMVLGECAGAGPVLRRGAQLGDVILVTGSLGASPAGLALLGLRDSKGMEAAEGASPDRAERYEPARARRRRQRVPAEAAEEALRAHLEPQARCREGILLGQAGLATSMIDISDGLLADLHHVCSASGVGAEVDGKKVPVAPSGRLIAAALGQDPQVWAMEGGEDYELLFTCRPERAAEARALIRSGTGTQVTPVGFITEARGVVVHGYHPTGGQGGFRHF